MTRRTDPIWDDDDVDVLVGLGILVALAAVGGVAIVLGSTSAWIAGATMSLAAAIKVAVSMTRAWKRTA